MENDGEGKEEYTYLFPNEEYFPVLLSLVLPQHARIFTACMVQGWSLDSRTIQL